MKIYELLEKFVRIPFVLCVAHQLKEIMTKNMRMRMDTKTVRLNFPVEAARYGYFQLLMWSESAMGCSCLSIAKVIMHGKEVNVSVADMAACNGHLEVLRWSVSRGCVLTPLTMEFAFGENRRKVIEWLWQMKCQITPQACIEAARMGHLRPIQWSALHSREYNKPEVTQMAASRGHIHIVKWLLEKNFVSSSLICNAAAEGGQLGIIQWTVEQGFPRDRDSIRLAVQSGHLGAVRWMLDNDFPVVSSICDEAAIKGQLAVLKLLRQRGFAWSRDTLFDAVRGAHSDAVLWMLENGCPWDKYIFVTVRRFDMTFRNAILEWLLLNTHDDTVQWLENIWADNMTHV